MFADVPTKDALGCEPPASHPWPMKLLDVSRITSGKLHLQRNRLDLRDAVSRAIETLEWDLQERQHTLDIELPGVPVWLQADERRLEQVFVNLLANASRFTDPGGQLRVRVSIESDQAVVRIRDSGIGYTTRSRDRPAGEFVSVHTRQRWACTVQS